MNNPDTLAFISLFKNAYEKCFGQPLQKPMNETESKLFYNSILEQTGLVIGWKSIKNYSSYVLNNAPGKQENPSTATLDTLARYVLNAPYTNELNRKNKESHYPYWFEYRKKFSEPSTEKPAPARRLITMVSVLVFVLIIAVLILLLLLRSHNPVTFTDNFISTNEDSLYSRGWFLQAKDSMYWNKRNTEPAHLALFTLNGDNWPDSANKPGIKNLLLRKITSDCFTAEIHLEDFLPQQNWQQAGIILMEDTAFKGKSARLSLMYNDYTGGAPRSREIIVQAISSPGNGLTKPEEIAHKTIFTFERDSAIIKYNLQNIALRIEKHGKTFRFLYSNSALENAAFKEAATQQLDITPKYIGLFALQGFVNNNNYIPAYFNFFSLASEPCNE